MINLNKSQPGPAGDLEHEKAKASGSYNIASVVTALKNDSFDKCYICERKNPSSIEIEHFVAHQGDNNLKFNWNNLFFSCRHCNNSKGAGTFDNMLNCTIEEDSIELSIKFEINPLPKEVPIFTALRNDAKVENTIALLKKVYIGNTPQKLLEASYLRTELLKDVLYFYNLLSEYDNSHSPNSKAFYKMKITEQLASSSAYTAFKRRIIRDHEQLLLEFGEFLN